MVSWGVLFYAISAFVGPMSADLGGSRAAIAGAFSLMTVVAGVAGLGVGHWLDRRGPRLLMTAGSIAGALLVLAWSRVHDLATFYLVWVGIGLAFAAVNYSPAFATVAVWFRRHRARALAAVTLMAGFASTVFIPLAAWLISLQGWRMALVTLAAVLALVTVPAHALLLRRRPADLGLRVDGDPHAEGVTPSHEAELGASVREALRHPSFPWLAATFALYALNVAVPVHLVAFLSDQGYALPFAAAAAGSIGAAQVFGRVVFARIERSLRPRVLSVSVYALAPLALVVLLLFRGELAVGTFVLLYGASRGMDTLVRSVIVADVYGTRRYASISSVFVLLTTFGAALAPLGLGAAYDLLGSYVPGLWALAAAHLGAVAFIYVGDRRV